MKFHWFAEFFYTKLADDYGDTVHSAWVDPPMTSFDPTLVGEDYRMYLRLMQQADRQGWDSVLLNEHHQTSFAMSPSPNLFAAVLAATTENAAIALCGNSLALYNPPVRIAEEMATLDTLSGGRLIAGMVFGTPQDSSFAYGMPPVEVRDRFHEARELITRAWSEPEPFAFNGTYNKLRYVNIWPRPIQKNIPIWVPGSGSVETWDVVNDNDYCYGYLSFSGKQSALPIVNEFWEYTESTGANMNPNRMAFTQLICTADSDKEAEEKYYEAVRSFYRQNPVAPEFAAPPGYNSLPSVRAMLNRSKTISAEQRAKAAKGELSFWEYDELGYIIAGTPERVEQRVRELATELRIGQLITAMHIGNLDEETAAMNVDLFGEKVIPKLRDIHSEYEDLWTPQESQRRVAAAAERKLAASGAGAMA
ncbi:LLM class flavin-dependent oxidoreductase [Nakamurella leprariae]|uniref:LLM class flavin-dependent oxidoreductase n=1 Tax=Nakamurella leprariae TaxID=2803911 RepID=A0A938Y9Y6_9ACTN|nr:LLM class flavin-dependent oxidoreductase [Nakamurella leprariae]MBM9468600.1 LLM class flavin-dependent oxidoreductase [Nakamurella leprariae]